jgi:catechol 2,3-dioxygenase-like lactoylglutathione lyase family enzyme
MFTQIKETGLYVQDLDRTEFFYNGKLDLEIISKSEGRHIFFKAGSSVLLCFIADATKNDEKLPGHFGEGKMHIAFEVPKDKYADTKKWIRSRGIEIEHEQQWGEDYHSFYFRDPDGHSLEIVPEGLWG